MYELKKIVGSNIFSAQFIKIISHYKNIGDSINVLQSTQSQLATLLYSLIVRHWVGLYQSPLILTELIQHNLINVSYLTACYLYQVMMTLHFLNDVANDAESTQK